MSPLDCIFPFTINWPIVSIQILLYESLCKLKPVPLIFPFTDKFEELIMIELLLVFMQFPPDESQIFAEPDVVKECNVVSPLTFTVLRVVIPVTVNLGKLAVYT